TQNRHRFATIERAHARLRAAAGGGNQHRVAPAVPLFGAIKLVHQIDPGGHGIAAAEAHARRPRTLHVAGEVHHREAAFVFLDGGPRLPDHAVAAADEG